MSEATSRKQFDALLDGHRVVPVIRELFADGETPVGIYRKLAKGEPGSFLLESAEQGGIWSRYSFIGVSSFGVLTQSTDDTGAHAAVWLDYGLSAERALGHDCPIGPLAALEHLYERWVTPHVPGHPPHRWPGRLHWVGSDPPNRAFTERASGRFRLPGQALSFVSELVVVDHRTGTVLLIATVLNDGVDAAEQLWLAAQSRLDRMQSALAQPAEAWLAEVDLSVAAAPIPRIQRSNFHQAIERSKKFIRDGDVFQVVISQRFDHEITADPIDVYRVLRTLNPSPYMYLLFLVTPEESRTGSLDPRRKRWSRSRIPASTCTPSRDPAPAGSAQRKI